MRIEKLKPDKHRRRFRIGELPEPERTKAIRKRHELLTRWQQNNYRIMRKGYRVAYPLATAIAIGLAIHPRGHDWGVSMLQKVHGRLRFRKSTLEDWKLMSSKGGCCSRTTRRVKQRRRQLELEAKSPLGPDGLIPTQWYKKPPAYES